MEAVGPKVLALRPGDKVCTYMVPQPHDRVPVTLPDISIGLGQQVDGVIAVTGLLGGEADERAPSVLDCLLSLCTTRGVLLGLRKRFHAMNKFIEANDIKPVVDKKTFSLLGLKEAYEYLGGQQRFSKTVITCASFVRSRLMLQWALGMRWEWSRT